jgi:hypothetical protein
MKVPVTALIAIKLDLLLRREKTEQSILVDNEWLDTETIAIFQTGNQVLKKNNLRSLKLTS